MVVPGSFQNSAAVFCAAVSGAKAGGTAGRRDRHPVSAVAEPVHSVCSTLLGILGRLDERGAGPAG